MLKFHHYYEGLKPTDIEVEWINESLQAGFDLARTTFSKDESNIPSPASIPDKKDIYPAAIKRFSRELSALQNLTEFEISNKPTTPIRDKGWHEYIDGKWIAIVLPPSHGVFVLDIETYQVSETKWLPFCVTAYDTEDKVWYQWLHNADKPEALYPFSDHNIICGHNIGYDRSYMANEYRLTSNNYFVDTQSCWYTIRGITNQQKFAFHQEYQPLWTTETESGASLRDIYRFYYGTDIDKSTREKGKRGGYDWMSRNTREVLLYNLDDIVHTSQILTKVMTEWLDAIPRDISRIAYLLKSQYIVPMDEDSREWYEATEQQYQDLMDKALNLVSEAGASYFQTYQDNATHPQVQYLDTTPAKSGVRKGMPKYIRDLFSLSGQISKPSLMADITPVLLKLKYSDTQDVDGKYINHEYLYMAPWSQDTKRKTWRTESWELPHGKEGEDSPCSSLFTKDNAKSIFSNGQITSDDGYGKQIIDIILTVSTWKSIRKRANEVTDNIHRNFAVVAGCQTGTVTRRYTDPYWMVLPNPKKGKLGTEVKAKVKARNGYQLLIADFAGQEAHLAALVSCIARGIPGSNMFSHILALGDKANKTDIHSMIATSIGIARDFAKNGFYGAMYGIGIKGLNALFKSCGVPDALGKATKFRAWLVGTKQDGKVVGGLASDYYNWLDMECNKKQPVSPVLKAKMSKTLAGNKDFKTTRGNWLIQTSGVDCLDLLIVAMNELYYREGWDTKAAKLLISIHDEVWVHTRQDLVPKAMELLQYAHFLCWDYVYEATGMCGLPSMYIWFPDIGVDKYGRKEVFVDCKTPSNPNGFPSHSYCDIATKEHIQIKAYSQYECFS